MFDASTDLHPSARRPLLPAPEEPESHLDLPLVPVESNRGAHRIRHQSSLVLLSVILTLLPSASKAAEDQQRLMSSMSVVRDLLGSRYGGIWITPEAGEDRLNVRVVGLDDAHERRLRDALPDDLKLSVFDARFSHRELLDLYEEIDDSDIWDRFSMINGLGVSDRLNAVDVTLQEESPEAVRELQSLGPAGAIQVRVEPHDMRIGPEPLERQPPLWLVAAGVLIALASLVLIVRKRVAGRGLAAR